MIASKHVPLAGAVVVVFGLATVPARGQETVGPVGSATRAVSAPPRARVLEDAIGESDRERARRARERDGPFPPSGVWLPPFYLADAAHSIEWAGVLYLSVTDFEAGTRTRLLPPFFLSLAGPESRLVLTPLFGSRRDAEGEAGFLGPWLWRRDALAESDVVLPFYWSFRERDLDGGPWARSSGGVAPLLFWRRRTSGEHWTIAPPLFWRWGDGKSSTTLAGPAYYREEPGSARFGVVPFYFATRDAKDDRAVDLAPPLLTFRVKEGARSFLLAGPGFRRTDETSSDAGILPLWLGGTRDGGKSRYDLVPPLLFARTSDDDTKTSTTWCLNTLYRSRKDGHTLVSLPVLYSHREGAETTAVAALGYHHADATTSDTGVLPLWFGGTRESGNRRYDVIPPLLFARTSDAKAETSTTWCLNTVYRSRKDGHSLVSLPFLVSQRDGPKSATVAPPLFWRFTDEKTKTTVAALAYHHSDEKSSDTGVLPLWLGGSRDEGKKRYDVIPPLLFARTSDDAAKTSTTWCLNTIYRSRPDGHTLAAVPFLFSNREGAKSATVAPPLFWRFTDEKTSTTVAGPVYHRADEAGHDFGIAPVWFSGERDEGKRRYDVIPPLLFARASDAKAETSTTWCLNTIYRSRPDGYTLGSFPLGWATRTGKESRVVVPPALTFHASDEEVSTTIVANTWVRLRPNGWSFAFAPLLFGGRDDDRSHLVGFPLLWHFGDGKKSTTLAGPVYHWTDGESWRAGLPPLWFSGRDADGTGYDLGLPLLYRFTGADGVRLTVLPLFDYASDATRTRIISPLLYHHRDRSPEVATSKTVILGLGWDVAGPTYHARVGFPLFWDVEDLEGKTRVTTFFPLYGRYERDVPAAADTMRETTHVLLNTIWSSGAATSGRRSWSFHFVPLVDLVSESEDHLHWQLFGGLVGRERKGTKSRWRVGWIWTDPTEG